MNPKSKVFINYSSKSSKANFRLFLPIRATLSRFRNKFNLKFLTLSLKFKHRFNNTNSSKWAKLTSGKEIRHQATPVAMVSVMVPI